MTNFGQWSDLKPLKSVTCLIFAERKCFIEMRSVANLKMKNLRDGNTTANNIAFVQKFQLQLLGICFLIAIHFENYFLSNGIFFINLNFWSVVSAQRPNLINIWLWSKRRTFLCLNTWSISGSGTIFTTLHFLRTSQINPIS